MRRLVRLWVPAVLAVLFAPPAPGDSPEFEAAAQRGIAHIYNLEYENAEAEFRRLVAMDASHPAGHFFLAMTDWWRIMIDLEDTRYDRRFHEQLDRVIELCDDRLDRNGDDVTALFFKGGALGFKGRLRFHRDDWFAAADAGRRALPIVQTASSADPNNFDIFLGTGIYNYYAAVLPEQYPVARPLMLFIPAGDKEKGIQQLQTAAKKGKYARVEASYFLMQIFYQFEKRYADALALALELHERYPNNMMFHKYVGRSHVAMGAWAPGEEVFREIAARCERKQPGYNALTEREARYYMGVAAQNRGDAEAGLKELLRCDELSRTLDTGGPSGFMVQANLKMGLLYDQTGRRDLAVKQYRKVLDMKDYRDSHKQAEQLLKSPPK
jgi:tetratricopeptide (TPR) repeat protein